MDGTCFSTALREIPDWASVSSGSVSCLLSMGRICISLYRLCAVSGGSWGGGKASDYASLSSRLFEVILQRVSVPGLPLAKRAQLADALYALARETGKSYDPVLAHLCDTGVFGVLRDWNPASGEVLDADTEVAVCRLLESFFYPELWEEDDWCVFLQSTLQGWCASLSSDGCWMGLPAWQSWQRIAVLNRYSYLFRDDRYDSGTCLAFRGQTARLSFPWDNLPLTEACLDACLPGHLCVWPQAVWHGLSDELQRQREKYPIGSDERLMALSNELDFYLPSKKTIPL